MQIGLPVSLAQGGWLHEQLAAGLISQTGCETIRADN